MAFLLPSSAINFNLLSFNEIKAISDAAKNAFSTMSKTKTNISVNKIFILHVISITIKTPELRGPSFLPL
jgi:hypothetical protein